MLASDARGGASSSAANRSRYAACRRTSAPKSQERRRVCKNDARDRRATSGPIARRACRRQTTPAPTTARCAQRRSSNEKIDRWDRQTWRDDKERVRDRQTVRASRCRRRLVSSTASSSTTRAWRRVAQCDVVRATIRRRRARRPGKRRAARRRRRRRRRAAASRRATTDAAMNRRVVGYVLISTREQTNKPAATTRGR